MEVQRFANPGVGGDGLVAFIICLAKTNFNAAGSNERAHKMLATQFPPRNDRSFRRKESASKRGRIGVHFDSGVMILHKCKMSP